jgi:hypothetical protein
MKEKVIIVRWILTGYPEPYVLSLLAHIKPSPFSHTELYLFNDAGGLLVSSWLRIQKTRVRFPALQIFWKIVGLERGPLSLVSTTEELLGRNSSGSGLENREYGRGDPLRWPRDTLNPQKLALTSPTRDGRSVGIVRLRTKATEFFVCLLIAQIISVSLRMVNECWIGKDEQRNGHDMFQGIYPNSSGDPEENLEKAQDNCCPDGDSNCVSPE